MKNEQGKVYGDVTIENARIFKRNFSGRAIPPYNPEGVRNFCLAIPEDLFASMTDDGWNTKVKKSETDPDMPPLLYVPVAVNFEYNPPKIVEIVNGRQILLDAKSVGILDSVSIASVDLTIHPYNWEALGNTGVKAYLKTMYVTINLDPLEEKYFNSEV